MKPPILTTVIVVSGLLTLCAAGPGFRPAGMRPSAAVQTPVHASVEEERARRRLAQAEAAPTRSEEAIADALDALVEVLYGDGRAADRESHDLAARAVSLRERLNGPDDLRTAVSRRNHGRLLFLAGDYQPARRLLEDVLALRKRLLPPDDLLVAQSLGDLGGLLCNTADLAAAETLHEQAIAIYRRKEPVGAALARQLANLALVRLRLDDAAGTTALLQEALEIRRKAGLPDDPGSAHILLMLADFKFLQGDFTAARSLYERILAIASDTLPPTHYITGFALRGLGGISLQQKNYEEARQYFERALASQAESLGPENPMIAIMYTGLAFARLGLGDAAGARAILEDTLEAQERTIGHRHPSTGWTEACLARVLFPSGDDRGALDRALEAESIQRRHFLDTARALRQQDALRFEPESHDPVNLAWAILTGTRSRSPAAEVTRVWDRAIRSRAMVLEEMGRRHHATADAATTEVARLSGALDRASVTLAQLTDEGPGSESPAAYAGRLARADEERVRIAKGLEEASPAFRRYARRSEVGFEEILRALPEGSAMVAYFDYEPTTLLEPLGPPESASLAVVLSPGSREPSLVPLGPAAAIEAAVRRWRDEVGVDPRRPGPRGHHDAGGLRAAEERYEQAGRRLRELVWDPVAEKVRGAAMVFVIPDGALQLVNFATLPVPEGGYLIDTGPLLHTLSSERDVVLDAERTNPDGGLLAIGGVDFDAGTVLRSSQEVVAPVDSSQPACGQRPAHFSPLPWSAAESRAIQQIWQTRTGAGNSAGETFLLTGSEADEAAFRREAPRHAVLHIATHGFFVDRNCADDMKQGGANIRVVPREQMAGQQPFAADPFALSGLALAGANRRPDPGAEPGPDARPDDGILTAEEIAALDLSQVRWVVLSACNTGVGRVLPGEGVLGLRRAFAIAGAGTIIMSLWPVEDAVSAVWMQRLYEARAGGLTTPESIRQAGLQVLAWRRRQGLTTHPFYWGAFVATGDWK